MRAVADDGRRCPVQATAASPVTELAAMAVCSLVDDQMPARTAHIYVLVIAVLVVAIMLQHYL